MSSLPSRSGAAPGPVWVALDLETTGLAPETDAIIEIGAVRFHEGAALDSFSTLVNPRRPLPAAIQALTGITQAELQRAPDFSAVRDGLAAFVGASPMVGHNVSFDLAFLKRAGLPMSGRAYDTLELASVLLPSQGGYSLGGLARALGVEHPQAHRAGPDARATAGVFLRLLALLRDLPALVRGELVRIASHSDWPLRFLFREVLGDGALALSAGEPGLAGLDLPALAGRLQAADPLRPASRGAPVEAGLCQALLASDGPLAKTLPAYEERPDQGRMAEGVVAVLNEGGRLIVEAGTGTGKSLAYLLPSLLYGLRNGERVVVSTNTITLQEQLVTKDIPDALRALQPKGGLGTRPEGEARFAVLKGRANYLCLRRWGLMKQGESLTALEARVLAKVLVWLQQTATGDRGEMNLTGPEAVLWDRLSAQGFEEGSGPCPFARRGLCFYNAARRRAEAAHLVVVNHALLALDAVHGSLLPESSRLVIDEAHHLEDVATSQWGSSVDEDAFDDLLDRVAGGSGRSASSLLAPLAALGRSALVAQSRRSDILAVVRGTQETVRRAQERLAGLFRLLADFAVKHSQGGDYGVAFRLTRSARVQPAWSQVEIAWEDANLLLDQLRRDLERLHSLASQSAEGELPDKEGYLLDVGTLAQRAAELAEGLHRAVAAPDEAQVYWISVGAKDGSAVVRAAPLEVGPDLEARLFRPKQAVVLTSATLSVEGSLRYVKERLRLDDARELALGSLFDYPRQVLLYAPDDIPAPNAPRYPEALAAAIADAARAAGGRTMALFTGWAALRAARTRLQEALAGDGITVLAQGADGPPQPVIETFRQRPRVVLLGTGSFWEGVDVPGEALSVLIITRLPFNVPTDPVFAARSQQFEDPFNSYAVPQAVLRFKQGFGRLVRRKTDRGVLVVLDRRILSKAYGSAFLDSTPKCTVRVGPSRDLPHQTVRWLAQRPLAAPA